MARSLRDAGKMTINSISHRSTKRILAALLVGALVPVLAQEPSAPPADTTPRPAAAEVEPQAPPAGDGQSSAPDDVDIDDWEMPTLPPGMDDDIFIPSEEIAADEEIIFPVDI